MTFAVRTLIDAGGGGGGGGSWTPVTDNYRAAGTFTETIPGDVATGGPSLLVIELGAAGGGGAYSPLLNGPQPEIGGSGGSGSLCRSTFALTSADWGKTFSITVPFGGAGGNSSFMDGLNGGTCKVTNGSFTRVVNMQAGGGFGGIAARGAGGAGGVASGGNSANLSGNAGQSGASQGGVGVTGVDQLVTSGPGGASSIVVGGPGAPGQAGSGAFAYT